MFEVPEKGAGWLQRCDARPMPRITVVVRKRPLSTTEVKKSEVDVVTLDDPQTVVVEEPRTKVDTTKYIERHEFKVDKAFDENASNSEIYQYCIKPLIVLALKENAKCSCFAYGQTGSGKTFTMLGPAPYDGTGEPGVFELAAVELFNYLDAVPSLSAYVSFYEIYCGKLYDLLQKRKLVAALENGKKEVIVKDLKVERVTSKETLLSKMIEGVELRKIGANSVNIESSRSHAVLQIDLRQSQNDESGGKIAFIDLAGSERGADTISHSRSIQQDGAGINRSLLALKECIRAMDSDSKHIPFRDSELTKVLRDIFVGKSHSLMIANITPSTSCCEQTLNTLRYATRVKHFRMSAPPKSIETDDTDSDTYNSSTYSSAVASVYRAAAAAADVLKPLILSGTNHSLSNTAAIRQSSVVGTERGKGVVDEGSWLNGSLVEGMGGERRSHSLIGDASNTGKLLESSSVGHRDGVDTVGSLWMSKNAPLRRSTTAKSVHSALVPPESSLTAVRKMKGGVNGVSNASSLNSSKSSLPSKVIASFSTIKGLPSVRALSQEAIKRPRHVEKDTPLLLDASTESNELLLQHSNKELPKLQRTTRVPVSPHCKFSAGSHTSRTSANTSSTTRIPTPSIAQSRSASLDTGVTTTSALISEESTSTSLVVSCLNQPKVFEDSSAVAASYPYKINGRTSDSQTTRAMHEEMLDSTSCLVPSMTEEEKKEKKKPRPSRMGHSSRLPSSKPSAAQDGTEERSKPLDGSTLRRDTLKSSASPYASLKATPLRRGMEAPLDTTSRRGTSLSLPGFRSDTYVAAASKTLPSLRGQTKSAMTNYFSPKMEKKSFEKSEAVPSGGCKFNQNAQFGLIDSPTAIRLEAPSQQNSGMSLKHSADKSRTMLFSSNFIRHRGGEAFTLSPATASIDSTAMTVNSDASSSPVAPLNSIPVATAQCSSGTQMVGSSDSLVLAVSAADKEKNTAPSYGLPSVALTESHEGHMTNVKATPGVLPELNAYIRPPILPSTSAAASSTVWSGRIPSSSQISSSATRTVTDAPLIHELPAAEGLNVGVSKEDASKPYSDYFDASPHKFRYSHFESSNNVSSFEVLELDDNSQALLHRLKPTESMQSDPHTVLRNSFGVDKKIVQMQLSELSMFGQMSYRARQNLLRKLFSVLSTSGTKDIASNMAEDFVSMNPKRQARLTERIGEDMIEYIRRQIEAECVHLLKLRQVWMEAENLKQLHKIIALEYHEKSAKGVLFGTEESASSKSLSSAEENDGMDDIWYSYEEK